MTRVIFLVAAAVVGLASVVAGIVCLVRYAQTRKAGLLIAGLLLTFLVPGALVLAALAIWIPRPFVVYAPPPPRPTP